MKKKILQLLGMVLFVGLLAGCGSNNEKTVVFSDAGWDSVKFHNAVAGLIAEKAYGLKVETMNGSTPIMEAALVRGDVDVNMELWKDFLHPQKVYCSGPDQKPCADQAPSAQCRAGDHLRSHNAVHTGPVYYHRS